MPERLLNKMEVAARFGTGTDLAASILRNHGVYPIDLGYGRSRGLRWLESAVDEVLRTLHANAQPKPEAPATKKVSKKRPLANMPPISLANMSIASLEKLISGPDSVN